MDRACFQVISPVFYLPFAHLCMRDLSKYVCTSGFLVSRISFVESSTRFAALLQWSVPIAARTTFNRVH